MIEEKIKELGLELPEVAKPLAAYIPAKQVGNLVMTSGQVPLVIGVINFAGKVGSDLTEEEVAEIRSVITAEYRVEGALRSEVQQNIKRLMDIGSYRGVRHRKSLPARGQRTRTNSRTRKGKRRTVAGKKKAPSKK